MREHTGSLASATNMPASQYWPSRAYNLPPLSVFCPSSSVSPVAAHSDSLLMVESPPPRLLRVVLAGQGGSEKRAKTTRGDRIQVEESQDWDGK